MPESVGDGDGVEEEDVGGFGLRDVIRVKRVFAFAVGGGVLFVDDEVGDLPRVDVQGAAFEQVVLAVMVEQAVRREVRGKDTWPRTDDGPDFVEQGVKQSFHAGFPG